jgi:hypothetical protein
MRGLILAAALLGPMKTKTPARGRGFVVPTKVNYLVWTQPLSAFDHWY